MPDFPNILGLNRERGTQIGGGAANMAIPGAENGEEDDWEPTGDPWWMNGRIPQAPKTPSQGAGSEVPETPSQSAPSPQSVLSTGTEGFLTSNDGGQDHSYASNEEVDELDESFILPANLESAENSSRMDIDSDSDDLYDD